MIYFWRKISTKNPVMNVLFDDLASSQVALVWDDMLRTVPLSDIKVNNLLTCWRPMESNHKFAQDSEIGSVVEPMVWVYIEDIDR